MSSLTRVIRMLALSCLALRPLEAFAQAMPPAPPDGTPTLDLGLIPDGEERMFQLFGRLNLETASQELAMQAVQRAMFQISPGSGFCIALTSPAEPTMLFLVGRESMGSPVLFDVNTGPDGISAASGRQVLLRTVAPIEQTTILLAAVVGQTSTAPGSSVDVFVRAYPDTTTPEMVEQICSVPPVMRSAPPLMN